MTRSMGMVGGGGGGGGLSDVSKSHCQQLVTPYLLIYLSFSLLICMFAFFLNWHIFTLQATCKVLTCISIKYVSYLLYQIW